MTKKFEYRDTDGKKKEAESYIASEFITTSAPNSPVKTGASGTLHPSLIPLLPVGKASSLVVDRVADGNILAGDLVGATASDKVGVSGTTSTDDATVLGMALNEASDGEAVEVLVLGIVSDPSFSSFSVNDTLFLLSDGSVTNIKPTTGYMTIVGKHLGGNDILINISPPLTLGA